jgi:hypothetical protein
MYQYLSWFKRGVTYPSGNKLISIEGMNKLKNTLLTSGVEVHESVQRYDQIGRVLFTPVYADFDGEDKLPDIRLFIDRCREEFKVTPDIYFSGNRGFHLFINVPVSHTHPHLVVKKLMATLLPKENDKAPYKFDEQMYGSRHLLRSEGSIHFKTNLFKVRVSAPELENIQSIRNKAKKQFVTIPTAHSSIQLELYLNTLYHLVDKDIKEAEEKYKDIQSEQKGEVPPCITSLIANGPVAGENNRILTLIARSFNSCGRPMIDAISEVANHPTWSDKRKDVESVFKSTYKQQSKFGCKNNEVLKRHCDQFCPFNELNIDIM